jgi:hypothetical protein
VIADFRKLLLIVEISVGEAVQCRIQVNFLSNLVLLVVDSALLCKVLLILTSNILDKSIVSRILFDHVFISLCPQMQHENIYEPQNELSFIFQIQWFVFENIVITLRNHF